MQITDKLDVHKKIISTNIPMRQQFNKNSGNLETLTRYLMFPPKLCTVAMWCVRKNPPIKLQEG